MKTFITKNKVKILVSTILILLFFLYRSNNKVNSYKNKASNELVIRLDSIKYYKSKLGQITASNKALLISQKDFKKGYYIKDDSLNDIIRKFKKVKSSVIIKTKTVIKEIKVSYKDTIPFNFEKKFEYNKPFYNISGVSTNKGITINNFTTSTTLRQVTGVKSNWFKKTITTDITSSNPFVKIKDIQSQTIEIKNKRIGIGVFTGYDYTLKPTIAIGISYNFIMF